MPDGGSDGVGVAVCWLVVLRRLGVVMLRLVVMLLLLLVLVLLRVTLRLRGLEKRSVVELGGIWIAEESPRGEVL